VILVYDNVYDKIIINVMNFGSSMISIISCIFYDIIISIYFIAGLVADTENRKD
jgi:hypothetical protein